jgi:hypothetical protein
MSRASERVSPSASPGLPDAIKKAVSRATAAWTPLAGMKTIVASAVMALTSANCAGERARAAST